MSAPLVFFHVPKTGGQTLAAIMARQYPRGAVVELWLQHPDNVRAFLALATPERHAIQALTGHFPFGVHEYLAPGARYITVLRDPVQRLLSEYRHVCESPLEWGVWRPPDTALASIDAYVDYTIDNHMANAQTRLIAGDLALTDRPPLSPLAPDALDRAKAHLRAHFEVVGTTERFDETLLLVRHVLGWRKRIHYTRRNVRTHLAQRTVLSDAHRERLVAHTREDAELVAFGAAMLEERLRACGQDFTEPLRRLRRVNRLLNVVIDVAHVPAIRALRTFPPTRALWRAAAGVLTRFS